ncbi:MAG: sialate O-acetylesterase, partial [Hymenobacter sp.]
MLTAKSNTTLIISLLSVSVAQTTVRLPALVGSHMVLQRDRPVPVWGWAAPGEAVTLTLAGQRYAASAPDATGRWQATLPAMPAGGPYTLQVRGRSTIELTDVVFGDVWLAAWQSNMQYMVKDGLDRMKDSHAGVYQPISHADEEIAAAT